MLDLFLIIPIIIILVAVPLYPKWSYKEYAQRSERRCEENPSLLWGGKEKSGV